MSSKSERLIIETPFEILIPHIEDGINASKVEIPSLEVKKWKSHLGEDYLLHSHEIPAIRFGNLGKIHVRAISEIKSSIEISMPPFPTNTVRFEETVSDDISPPIKFLEDVPNWENGALEQTLDFHSEEQVNEDIQGYMFTDFWMEERVSTQSLLINTLLTHLVNVKVVQLTKSQLAEQKRGITLYWLLFEKPETLIPADLSRDEDIIRRCNLGQSSKQIGHVHFIEEKTVNNYISKLRKKYGEAKVHRRVKRSDT
jgi:hypothetical protein